MPMFVSPRRARKSRRNRKKISLKFLIINSRKGQDLIQYVPSEIMIVILSRLPVTSIMRCKCVCKSWLDLIKSDEFVNSHRSESVPGLAVLGDEYVLRPVPGLDEYEEEDKEFIELVDGVDLNFRWKIDVNVFDAPGIRLHSCANGLLFLHATDHHIICNPVTREYFVLPYHPWRRPSLFYEHYEFGVSRMSGEIKVVRSLIEERGFIECLQVYTVGSWGCEWRSITHPGLIECSCIDLGAFMRGNLHFYVEGSWKRRIYCIDLETELFSSFSAPPLPLDEFSYTTNLSVFRDCLCVFGYSFISYEVDIWLMKEYGNEKSWTKELSVGVGVGRAFVYGFPSSYCLRPIKVLENGDIVMEENGGRVFYYSRKTATTREARDVFGLERYTYMDARIYTPSFLSLKANFPMQIVYSF